MCYAIRHCLSFLPLALAASTSAEPTRIYLDFGFGWELQQAGLWDLGTHECDGLPLRGCGSHANYLAQAGLPWTRPDHLPSSIMPLWYELERKPDPDTEVDGVDYDGAGGADAWDAVAVANDVTAYVEEYFAPFDVEVVQVASQTLEDAAAVLAATPGHDVYIFVGGESGSSGIATFDWGNAQDDIGFAFAGNAIGPRLGESEWSVDVGSIARTVAHEAAHTFGLAHTGTLGAGVWWGDFMSHFSMPGARVLRFPMPWADEIAADPPADLEDAYEVAQGLPFAETRQNAFSVLKDVLGLRPGAPAYVTGTGLHDRIVISDWGLFAYAQVDAYSDEARTQLVASHDYFVPKGNGVYVEAGPGDDYVKIDFAIASEIRGGPGDDHLVGGGGADLLVGGPGDDELSVGAGRDAVRYGPLTDVVLDGGKPHPDAGLGTDVLRDAGGFDTLDFAGFPERVVIDLGDDAVQVVDPPSLFEQLVLPSREAPPAPRLRVRLEPANGGASFENVIGSEHGDVLTGTSAANRLEGRGGNDVIEGGGGRDSIVGGAGTDQCSNAGQLVLCEAPPLVTAPQAGALLP